MENLQFENVHVFQGEDGAWHLSYECGNSRKILPLAEIHAAQQPLAPDACAMRGKCAEVGVDDFGKCWNCGKPRR